jgi:peptide/nickel transport system substrate-binding protein
MSYSTHPLKQKRRRVSHKVAPLMAIATAATCALAACSSASSTHDTASQSGQGHSLLTSTPPAKGSVANLTWDLPLGEPTSLDYVKSGTPPQNVLVANMCDTLRRVTPNLTFAPNLATSYKYSADHLTLTYAIREGVKFWDGTALTAADVAYSLNRNMNPADAPVNGYVYSNVASINATGRYTVVVKFQQPDEMFNSEMAGAPGEIAEKAYIQKKGQAYGTVAGGVMCSGPYKLAEWNAGRDIVLAANTSYWNKTLIPYAKTVTLQFITDTGTLVQALKSGAIDGAYGIPATVIQALQGNGAGKLYFGESPQLDVFLPNDTPAGNDENIRKALSMVLDRSALAAKIYNGAAEPAYSILPKPLWDKRALPTYKTIDQQLNLPTTPNLTAAKALIKGDPIAKQPITINTEAGDQLLGNVLALLQQEAQSIGLNVQIKVQQPLQFNNAFYESTARKGIDFIFDQTYTYVPDPLDYLTDNVYEGGALTYIKSPNGAKATAYFAQARRTVGDAQRAVLTGKALKFATAGQLVIPIVTRDLTLYMNKRITGAIPTWGYFGYPSFAVIGSSS